MSYDVYLNYPEHELDIACECGKLHHVVRDEQEVYWRNMTSNVAPMWRHAGIDLGEWAYGKRPNDRACVLIEPLERAIAAMRANPDTYRAMNPANGWGDYEGALDYLETLLAACRRYPDASIYVSN